MILRIKVVVGSETYFIGYNGRNMVVLDHEDPKQSSVVLETQMEFSTKNISEAFKQLKDRHAHINAD